MGKSAADPIAGFGARVQKGGRRESLDGDNSVSRQELKAISIYHQTSVLPKFDRPVSRVSEQSLCQQMPQELRGGAKTYNG